MSVVSLHLSVLFLMGLEGRDSLQKPIGEWEMSFEIAIPPLVVTLHMS